VFIIYFIIEQVHIASNFIPTATHTMFWTLERYISSQSVSQSEEKITRMWANAQRDGRPAERRWRPLFNAAKFG